MIQQCCRDLEKMGYWDEITLKSDQEVAIRDVLQEIAVKRGTRRTLIEHAPVGESQSNGFIERGVKSIEEMTRVLLLDLADRVGERVSLKSLCFPWLIEHATDLLNKCHVAADGKTAYERLKGKAHREFFTLSAARSCFGSLGRSQEE